MLIKRCFQIALTALFACWLSMITTWTLGAEPEEESASMAQWIWPDLNDPAPKNRFTYFRKVVDLEEQPSARELYFAADSNARLWINGNLVRRKVARYHEEQITTEVINAAPYLRTGKNVVVVLHHNWGDITTFQRTGNQHAGLYINSEWLVSDSTWRCVTAPEFLPHEKQVVGVIGHARIRYPIILDGRNVFTGDLHDPTFDDGSWEQAVIVPDGPWPEKPDAVETLGQREYPVIPLSVLAAGQVVSDEPLSEDPLSMAARIRTAKCVPNEMSARQAGQVLTGHSVIITGHAGETRYITFDFGAPTHGYPFLELDGASEGVMIDLGYCEIARSLYSGEEHVKPSGWINPEGVVGPGYADRYITRSGAQSAEMPDERTARWLTLHIHFENDGEIELRRVGIVKSQYPIKPIGSFDCGDERMNQIVKLCLIHAEVTMTDAYVDTPGREDGQWIEDDRPRALIAASWFGDYQLRRFLIRTHAQGQGEDGNLHPFSPSNYPAYPATFDWSVQWIACLYDDYMWTGQTDLLECYWDNICLYWDRVLSYINDEGLWTTNQVLADIRVGLHPENGKQSSGIVTPWIIERLHWSADMASAIGQSEKAKAWKKTAAAMEQAFRKFHIVPASDTIPAHVGDRFDPTNPKLSRGYSQAGQTIAITTGLMSGPDARKNVNYAFPAPDGTPPEGVTRWNNPTYGYRVLRALSTLGFSERAAAHCIERYSPYLPGNPRNPVPSILQGPYGGPLPEYWVSREDLNLKPGQKNPAQPHDETGSHGWQSVPLLWLHDTLLGVKIIEPGGGRIRIAPDDAGFPYVAGHVLTPKGLVWVNWDAQTFTLEIEIPNDVIAEVLMPKACRGKPLQIIEKAGKVNTLPPGFNYAVYEQGRYVFGVR